MEPEAKKVKPSISARFPQLDASLVSAALGAGARQAWTLEEMQRLILTGQAALKRLREPALPARTVDSEVLSESEDEVEEEALEFGSALSSSPPSMEAAIAKLAEVFSLLAADRVKKAKASKMDQALDNLGSTSAADGTGGGGALKRAAAARRALRQALQDTLEEVSAVVEKLLLEDLTSHTQAPAATLRAWLEHPSRISASYKTSAYAAWSAACILDNPMKGTFAHARAQAALLLLQLDLLAINPGSWSLASELALEQGPPLTLLANDNLPNVSEGERPFSRLLDARWSEVMLSHLRDAEDYVQKRRSLGRKLAQEDGHGEAPKAKPKAKGQESQDA